MAIKQYLDNILNSVFGKDVRQSIHDAIKQTYEDAAKNGNANMEVSEARGVFDTLGKRLDNSDTKKADKTQIDNLQNQIEGLASGSPLVANSVEEMTDTTRVYVNTSDGHWYYYNGAAWSDGGVYQATELADNSINSSKIVDKSLDILTLKDDISENFAKTYIPIIPETINTNGYYLIINNKLSFNENTGSDFYRNYSIPLEKGKIYYFAGYNNYDVKGLVIADSEMNVIQSSENKVKIGSGYNKTSLIFKCNKTNLTAYLSLTRTVVHNSIDYSNLNDLFGIYELNEIKTITRDFPLVTKENIQEINVLKNKYFRYDYPFSPRTLEGANVHIYPMHKNESYIVKSFNSYEIAGIIILDQVFNVVYKSANTYSGQYEECEYEFTAETDGFILISENDYEYSCKKYIPGGGENDKPLKNKLISYVGDSICQNFGGYASVISSIEECRTQNLAVGGATIGKYKTKSCIAEQIQSVDPECDMVIVEGGINDYWVEVPIGTIDLTTTNRYNTELDLTTFYGGLESIFRYLYNNLPTKPVIFVLNHKIKNVDMNLNQIGLPFEDYRTAIINTCKKYSIPYIDIYNDVNFNTNIAYLSETYTTNNDGTHPTVEGYRLFYAPIISDYLKKYNQK